MPAFLNILSRSLIIAVLSAISTVTAYAQCTVTKTEKNGVVNLRTTENYQYVKAGANYNALAISLMVKHKGTDVNYAVSFKYTGNRLSPNPVSVAFAMANDKKVETKLKLIKVQKTDNAKLTVRYYEAAPTPADIEILKQLPLKSFEVAFTARAPVSISVNDPTIIQSQIICLQRELK